MYILSSSPGVERDIARLERHAPTQDIERLRKAIRGLSEEPRPHGVMKLKGSSDGYRIRVGNYRVTYEVYDDAKIVAISRVLRRNEATYRE